MPVFIGNVCVCATDKDKPGRILRKVCVLKCFPSVSLSFSLFLSFPLFLSPSHCLLELGTKVSCVVCNFFNANHMLNPFV